ncbi:hypothetical protein P3X46_029502 [Hevea brasiliensis]|uniref:Bifunctional inhibitor/plant lipid transfer protein/seed storage helical domain-containing protein n=1 Tax=Hevea brasiliensis TaxID=3981 RepID=A0ABQ9KT94_HEVBR|nr:non-specific lipid-transfer protein 2 [Hevea brasiliensis]XP_057994638.1 non-specific lipid-transfer protein 2-like [Hevea brasiliensis]KAJ9147324.1 hypothetical protein P3X46_029498 [Hevea brasiliensis]KAJ9147328.1 hypothetical protein P3X46_029502 [Hevea brasiliensis]
MKKVSGSSLWMVVAVAALMLLTEVRLSNAVTCNPVQLSSCLPAISSSTAPSSTCCSKLREQKPCLCGYLKNPNLKQYVNSPGARKVANACGVPLPNC